MIIDWDGEVYVLGGVLDWGESILEIVPIEYLYLHAPVTSTLYHAEATTGESTPITVEHTLVDELGNNIVDEVGNQIIVYDSESAILFHAKATDTLYHAEA